MLPCATVLPTTGCLVPGQSLPAARAARSLPAQEEADAVLERGGEVPGTRLPCRAARVSATGAMPLRDPSGTPRNTAGWGSPVRNSRTSRP